MLAGGERVRVPPTLTQTRRAGDAGNVTARAEGVFQYLKTKPNFEELVSLLLPKAGQQKGPGVV